jgi:hypothetical protein
MSSGKKKQGKKPELDASAQRDLDETRRVALMLLVPTSRRNREIAATLVNALVYHQKAASFDEAMKYVCGLMNDDELYEEARDWLLRQVKGINKKLGD